MSEVKQTIPGVELTSPCSCFVYWAPRGLAKIVKYVNASIKLAFVYLWLSYLYPSILGLIVGFILQHNVVLLSHFDIKGDLRRDKRQA